MTFTYLSEFQQKFKPGDRLWVCGLRLNPKKTKLIRRQPPELMECVCSKYPEFEYEKRAKGRRPEYLAPLKDSQPVNKKAVTISMIHVFETQKEAEAKFNELLEQAIKETKQAQQDIEHNLEQLNRLRLQIRNGLL